jgi:hypothetical protein
LPHLRERGTPRAEVLLMLQIRRAARLAVPVLIASIAAGWLLAWAIDRSVPRRLFFQPVKWILRMPW